MNFSVKNQLEQLKKSIHQIMLVDAFSTRRKIQNIQSLLNSSKPVCKMLVNLQSKVEQSQQQVQSRLKNKPVTG
jgi:hypothetical protein